MQICPEPEDEIIGIDELEYGESAYAVYKDVTQEEYL